MLIIDQGTDQANQVLSCQLSEKEIDIFRLEKWWINLPLFLREKYINHTQTIHP